MQQEEEGIYKQTIQKLGLVLLRPDLNPAVGWEDGTC